MSMRCGLVRVRHSFRAQQALSVAHSSRALSNVWNFSFTRSEPARKTPEPSSPLPPPVQPASRRPSERALLVHRLTDAVATQDVAVVHNYYHLIREAMAKQPDDMPWLSRPQLLHAMSLLAATHAMLERNMELVDLILTDMPTLHQQEIAEDVHHDILASMLGSRVSPGLEGPHRYLFTMRERPGGFAPTAELWHLLLVKCSQRRNWDSMRRIIQDMMGTGCMPTLETYRILLRGVNGMSYAISMGEFQSIVNEMFGVGLPYDEVIAALISENHSQSGHDPAGALAIYEQKYASGPAAVAREPAPLLQELTQCAAEGGVQAALDLFQRKRKLEGAVVTKDMFEAILRFSHKLTELRRVERTLGIWAAQHPRIWLVLIKNADVKGYAHNAVEIFQQACKAGVATSPALVQPVVHALCQKADQGGAKASDAIDLALSIWGDLRAQLPPSENNSRVRSILRLLARAVASAEDRRFRPVLDSLLAEMSTYNVALDASLLHVVLSTRVREAKTPELAFAAYERLVRAKGLSLQLEAQGYFSVVRELCRIRPWQRDVVSADLLFSIVSDAHMAGLTDVVSFAYVAWFRSAGRLATFLRKQQDWDKVGPLRGEVERMHDRLTIDARLTPNGYVFTALMDAYQRAGMPAQAMRLWDSMRQQGRLTDAAVSVMLDTCSHSGMYSLLRDIWMSLRARRFPLNLQNWNNYVEALCRLDRLDEAIAVFLRDMDGTVGPRPDVSTVNRLMKYAQSTGRAEEVMGTVRAHDSRLWQTYERWRAEAPPAQAQEDAESADDEPESSSHLSTREEHAQSASAVSSAAPPQAFSSPDLVAGARTPIFRAHVANCES